MMAPAVGLRGTRNRTYTLADKLVARTIAQPSGCWEAQGYTSNGYVQIIHAERHYRAHVVAWELANGRRVPKGLEVMHSCDNRRCVNPAHLSLGTRRDNHLDAVRKGRKNAFGHQKLDAEKVWEIRTLLALGRLQKEIAKQFGVARNTISGIATGASWGHLNRPFVDSGHDGQSAASRPNTPVNSVAPRFV